MASQLDPRTLRAIAHPTRNRILAELFAAGPLRAADLAQLLDLPANQASFHLRQLAKYDLVEEAPELARDKRDRVWRLSDPDGISFRTKDIEAQPGGRAAMTFFRQHASSWAHLLVDLAYDDRPLPDGVNRTTSDWSLRLTAEEVDQLSQEIGDLVSRWRDRTSAASQEGRSTYSLLQLLQPYPSVEADDPLKDDFRVLGFGHTLDDRPRPDDDDPEDGADHGVDHGADDGADGDED